MIDNSDNLLKDLYNKTKLFNINPYGDDPQPLVAKDIIDLLDPLIQYCIGLEDRIIYLEQRLDENGLLQED